VRISNRFNPLWRKATANALAFPILATHDPELAKMQPLAAAEIGLGSTENIEETVGQSAHI
jgi:hypothetical protein